MPSTDGRVQDRVRLHMANNGSGHRPETRSAAQTVEEIVARMLDSTGRVDELGLAAAESDLVERQDWRTLSAAYIGAAKRAPDPETGRSLWLSTALLYVEKLDDPQGAEPWLRRVLASDPDNLDALLPLIRLMKDAGRAHEAANLLEQALDIAPPEEKAVFALDLASLANGTLGEKERALAALFTAYTEGVTVGEEGDQRAEILAQARLLLLEDGRPVEAAEVLEEETEQLLGASAEILQDVGADTTIDLDRVDRKTVTRLAEAHRTLGSMMLDHAVYHALARDLLERARRLGDDAALSALDALEGIATAWESRARMARDRGLEARDKKEAAAAYLEAAQLHLVYGQDNLRAEEYLDRARLLYPGQIFTLRVLETLDLQAGRHGELLKRLNGMVAAVKDADVKVRLLMSAARAAEAQAHMWDATGDKVGLEAAQDALLDALRRALAIAPDNREAAARLSAHLASLGRHEARAEVLERFLGAAKDHDLAVETHLELGRLAAEELGDAPRSRVHFEAALALRPGDFEAASALRALYKDAFEQPLLLEVLKVLEDHAPDLDSRLELVKERVQVAKEVGAAEAFHAVRTRFELDPDAEGAEAELADLAEELRRIEELADAYVSAARTRSGQRGQELWRAAARLFDARLPRLRQALHAWREVLRVDPTDSEGRDALERLLQAADDPGALEEILNARIAGAEDSAERRLARVKLAEVLEHQPDRLHDAIQVLEDSLSEEPEDDAALSALAGLLERSGDLERLEATLSRLETLARSDESRDGVLLRRARVLEAQGRRSESADLWLELLSSETGEALERLEALLAVGIRQVEIAAALEPIYESRGATAQRRDVLEVVAEFSEEPVLRRRATLIASDLSVELGHAERALDNLLLAFGRTPEDEELVHRIASLAPGCDGTERVLELLEGSITSLTGPARAAVVSALGRLYEDSDDDKAIDFYRHAVADMPSATAPFEALERLLGAQGRDQELADILRVQAQHAPTREERARAQLSLGTLLEDRLGDEEGALRAYREVLVLDPEESTALGRLANRWPAHEEPAELVAVLDRLRSQAQDAGAAAALDVRIGDIMRQHLGDPESAFARYVQAIAADGERPDAVAGLRALLTDDATKAKAGLALEPIFTAGGDYAGLVQALEAQASEDQDESAREARSIRVAELRAGPLGAPEDAFSGLLEAFEAGTLSPATYEQLGALAVESGRSDELLASMSAHARKDDDLETWRYYARFATEDASRLKEAREGWEAVLRQSPGDAEALEALEEVTSAGEDPSALADVLEARAESAGNDGDKARFLRRAATIWEEAAQDLERALAALARARELEPHDRTLWQETARVLAALGRAEEQAEALHEAAMVTQGDVPKARAFAAEAEARVALDQPEAALAAFISALEAAPDHLESQRGLESLLGGRAGAAAAQALEPFYRRAGDWAGLARAYRRLAEASTDRAERVERWVAIRSLEEEQLGDFDAAYEASRRAFQEAPEPLELVDDLERLAAKTGRAGELSEVVLAEALARPESEAQPELLKQAARLADAHGQDPVYAVRAWTAVVESNPSEPGPLASLAERLLAAGETRGAAETMVRQAALVEEARKADLLVSAATALESEDVRRAGDLFESALDARSDHREALAGLQRTRSHDPHRLASALSKAVVELEGVERAQAFMQLGRIQKDLLEQPERAFEAFATVLTLPEAESLYDDAAAALEGLIEACRSDRPHVAARAAGALEPFWRQRKAYRQLIQAKEARSESADRIQRVAIRKEIAEIYARNLELPEMAFLTLGRAFKEVPEDPDLAEEIAELAEAAHSLEEWAELNLEVLQDGHDPSVQLASARRAAALYDRRLGRAAASVPMYELVLELSPGDRDALVALERIHRSEGNAASLVSVQRRLLEQEASSIKARDRWAEIADLAEHDLSDPELAAEALAAVRRIEPANVEVLRRISALGERADRPALALEALEAELARTESVDGQASLLLQIASLSKDRMSNLEGAVRAYARVLDIRPQDPGALSGLVTILQSSPTPEVGADAAELLAPHHLRHGAMEEYLDCLERLSAGRRGASRKSYLLEMAEVYETKLGRPEPAFAAARRAFSEDPQDEATRDRIERLAAENSMFEDLAAAYLDEADRAGGDHTRVLDYRRRVAKIYETSLEDRNRAIDEYEQLLELYPGDAKALEAVEHLYEQSGNFERLAEVYRRRIARTEDEVERAQLMREFARIQGQELHDLPGAIATLRRLIQLVPDDRPSHARLADYLEQEGRTTELSDVLERLLALSESEPEALEARVRLGRVRAEHLGDLAAADRLLSEALEVDPRHAAAKEYLEERFEDAVADQDRALARRTGGILAKALHASAAWSELVSVLQLLASIESRATERVPLELEVARIQDEVMGQPELAYTTLASTLKRAPGYDEVRDRLEGLAQRMGNAASLIETYEAALPEAADAEVRERLQRRVAELWTSMDLARARDAWQKVLNVRPDDAQALATLDELDSALGQWAALADVLERRAELAAEPEDRYRFLVRLGDLWHERLGEPEEGLRFYQRAREEDPQGLEALDALSRLVQPEASPRELSEVLAALSEATIDSPARERLVARHAALASGPLDDPELAIALWQELLAADPDHLDAYQALEELYERTSRWTDLADLLEGRLQQGQDEQEVLRLQRRLGLIKGTRLGSAHEAVASWREILRRNPHDIEALEALRGIQQEGEEWEELVSTLRRLVPLQTDPDGVKSIRFELAEVLHTRLDRVDDAIESAKRVLELEPHTPAELIRLEEIFTAAGAHLEAVRVKTARADQAETRGERVEILFEVADLYENKIRRMSGAASAYELILELEPESARAYESLALLYQEMGDYRHLVELHDRRLEVIEDAEQRRVLLLHIVEIQERWLGHPELAFSAACRAFAEAGADQEAQALAERLAGETNNWDLLVEVYEEQLEHLGPARAVDLRLRLGVLYGEQLGEPELAEKHLAAVLSARPGDHDAAHRLRHIYSTQHRWDEMVGLLHGLVEVAPDRPSKVSLLFEIAELEESQRGDIDAAVASAKRVLDLEGDSDEALERLTRLYRDHGHWRPLVDTLRRRLERAGPDDIVDLRFQIADVSEKGLKNVSEAIETYQDVLQLEPGHRRTLDALERLHTHEERWTDLIQVWERRLQYTEQPEEAVELLSRIAGIQEEKFSDLKSAASTLIRALEADPEHLATVIRLERIWRAEKDHVRLVEALARHVELARQPEEATGLLLEVGRLQWFELEDPDKAQEALLHALRIGPDNQEVVHTLAELHAQQGRWFNALEMLAREVKIIGPVPAAAELHFRMGQLNDEMLSERSSAKEAYEKALAANPRHGPSLRALRAIREEEGGFDDAMALEAQEAEHTRDPEEKAKLYHHAAEVALDRFDDFAKASQYLELGLEGHPTHIPSLEVLSDLYFSEERWDEAEALLERLVGLLDPTSDRGGLGRLHYRLAYIAEKHGKPALALERYHASYEYDSTYLPTLEGLGEALLEAQRWDDAQRVFQAILIQHKAALTDAEVVDIHYQIGVLALKLDQLDRGRKSFERALELDRSHIPTLGAFAELAEREQEWEEAFDHREHLLELLTDEDERFDALLLQASLSESRIREPWRAIDAYVEAKRLRPDEVDVLRALVRLYRDTSQVPRALEVLNDLGLVLTGKEERRDVFLQMARVHLEQQGDVKAAAQALNAALDVDPEHIEAFSTIEQILYDARAWTDLEENYHRMLKRLPRSQRKARAVLWRSLSELYTKVLQNAEGARIAFEVLHRLEPGDQRVTEALADAYAKEGSKKANAAELYLGLVPVADDPAVPARALFNLFFEVGMLDRSFCALGALVLMGATDDTERRAYDGLLRFAPSGPVRSLTDSLWRERVLHPYCRNELANLCSVVYRGAPTLFEHRKRERALKPRRERVDLRDTRKNAPAKLRYFDVWARLQKVMHVPEAQHFLRTGSSDGPQLLPGEPPVLFAGRQNEVFQTGSSRRLAWVLGRQMAMARPELALVSALDPEEIAACLEAAILLHRPEGSGIDLGADPAEVAGWHKLLAKHLGDRAMGALREPVTHVVERRRMKVLARYLRGVEHSVNRAALLVAGDVSVAAQALDETPAFVPDVSHRARIRELMLFVLGADHFVLREKLGTKLAPQAEEAVRQHT